MNNAYLCILQNHTVLEEDDEATRIWHIPVPSNVQLFVWRLLLDKLPTKTNLNRCNILASEEELKCLLCKEQTKIASHLFFCCKFSGEIWNRCYRWLDLVMAQHNNPKQHFQQHYAGSFSKAVSNKAMSIWCTITWRIWQHRNKMVFTEEELDLEKLWNIIITRSWVWLSSKVQDFGYSW